MYDPKAEPPDNSGECACCGRITEDGRDVELCEEDGIEVRGKPVTGHAFLCDTCDDERLDRISCADLESAIEELEAIVTGDGLHPALRARKAVKMVETFRAELERVKQEKDALADEVLLTNEHEHQILQERNEARSEVERLKSAPVVVPELTEKVSQEVIAKTHYEDFPSGTKKWFRIGWAALASRLSSIKPGEVVVAIPDPTGIVVDLPERYREKGIELVRNAIQWAREHARIVPRAQATATEKEAM